MRTLILLTAVITTASLAQNTATPGSHRSTAPHVPGATVSGHVTAADTNGPARFARVLLKSTTPSNAGDDFMKMMNDTSSKSAKPKTDDQKKMEAQLSNMMRKASDISHSTTVGTDGSYTFTDVEPGTYYIHANFPGYIDPLAAFFADDLNSADPNVRAKIAAQTQTITINGPEAVHTDLTIQRGGAISGRVLFDDGLPATGWVVNIVDPKSTGEENTALAAMLEASIQMSGAASTVVPTTDDQGHFRINGLPSGDYMLQATLTATGLGRSGFNTVSIDPSNTSGVGVFGGGVAGTIHLTVYTGNTTRLADAKPITVRAGDEVSGVDITMPLRTLHSVTGHVIAQVDSHPVNSGTAELTGKDDNPIHLTAMIQADGAFRFDYVPTGSYTLTTKNAHDATSTGTEQILGETIATQKTLHSYGPATAEIILQDHDTETTLTVPDEPKK